jgi:type II secretory pathway component PulJ
MNRRQPIRPAVRRPRARGIAIWEMMVALALLATFAAVSVQLIRSSLRVPHRAAEAGELAGRFDAALGQLRRDVWGATAVKREGQDGRTIRIEHDGVPPIGWAITDDGALLRTGGAMAAPAAMERQEWAGVGRGMKFDADGSVLLLVEPPGRATDGRRIPLVNPLQASRGRTPS